MITDVANTLREGARAEIWYLADRHEEPHILRQIEEVQEAMEDAATALPQLIAALGWALDQIENDADPDHQAAFAAARATFEQYSREAA